MSLGESLGRSYDDSRTSIIRLQSLGCMYLVIIRMCYFKQDLYLNMKKNIGGSQKLFGQLRLSLVNDNGVG